MRRLPLTAICIAVASLLSECGGGGDGATETARATKHFQHVHSFDAHPTGRVIEISMDTRPCHGPSVGRIEVLRRHPRIVLRAYMVHSWVPEPAPPNTQWACPDEAIAVYGEVDLGEPVGGRAIYDAVRQPPLRRWPE